MDQLNVITLRVRESGIMRMHGQWSQTNNSKSILSILPSMEPQHVTMEDYLQVNSVLVVCLIICILVFVAELIFAARHEWKAALSRLFARIY